MSPVSNEPDDVLDEVLEDERTAALQNLRDQDENATEIVDLADDDE